MKMWKKEGRFGLLTAVLCVLMLFFVFAGEKAYASGNGLSGDEVYYVRDADSGRYLTVNGGQNYNFNPVGVYPMDETRSTLSMRWRVAEQSDGGYKLLPECASRMSLDISWGQADIYDCNSAYSSDIFYFEGDPFNGCRIRYKEGQDLRDLRAEENNPGGWNYIKAYSGTGTTWVFEKVCKITYYDESGDETLAVQYVKKGNTIIPINDPESGSGAEFIGWYEPGAESPYVFGTADENVELYAAFGLPVRVTFEYPIEEEPEYLDCVYGTALSEYTLPECPIYNVEIDGWYTDGSLQSEYDFDQPLTENITLYPRILVNVNYYADGVCISTETVVYGENANPPQEKFREWYTESGNLFNAKQMITGETSLYTTGHCLVLCKDYPDVVIKGISYSRSEGMLFYLRNGGDPTFADLDSLSAEDDFPVWSIYADGGGYKIGSLQGGNLSYHLDEHFDAVMPSLGKRFALWEVSVTENEEGKLCAAGFEKVTDLSDLDPDARYLFTDADEQMPSADQMHDLIDLDDLPYVFLIR